MEKGIAKGKKAGLENRTGSPKPHVEMPGSEAKGYTF
jgi:hypothetical protein